ncbi:hypothetical protein BC835DRAFT_660083 [Cytidiella melzeri]|nr:hypothetical protein BC835DRAFT_660083 [Cytidiella melzeri]
MQFSASLIFLAAIVTSAFYTVAMSAALGSSSGSHLDNLSSDPNIEDFWQPHPEDSNEMAAFKKLHAGAGGAFSIVTWVNYLKGKITLPEDKKQEIEEFTHWAQSQPTESEAAEFLQLVKNAAGQP